MDVKQFSDMFRAAAGSVIEKKEYLCQIDANTGDGDHGIAISQVAEAVIAASKEGFPTIGAYLEDVSQRIFTINGGSCIPLCGSMFESMAEAAADVKATNAKIAKKLFSAALAGIQSISNAQPGDKTMVDAIFPAVKAAQDTVGGNEYDVMVAAAKAAALGAESTKDMIAKYGRAKNLNEASIGYLDAGAVSISLFIQALCDHFPQI